MGAQLQRTAETPKKLHRLQRYVWVYSPEQQIHYLAYKTNHKAVKVKLLDLSGTQEQPYHWRNAKQVCYGVPLPHDIYGRENIERFYSAAKRRATIMNRRKKRG